MVVGEGPERRGFSFMESALRGLQLWGPSAALCRWAVVGLATR